MSNTRVIQLYTSYTVIHELYYLARISFFKAIALTLTLILIYRARF